MDVVEGSRNEHVGSLENLLEKSGSRRFRVGSANTVSKRKEEERWRKALSEGVRNKKKEVGRPSSAGHFWTGCTAEREQTAPERRDSDPRGAVQGSPLRPPARCRSSCEFSWHKGSRSDRDFRKIHRSLRLLGLEPSDLGVRSGGADAPAERKPRRRSPALSTRISCRSVSLDSLRVAVRRACLGDDGPDESLRRLLSQAAYEEWYFAKERELRQKREEIRMQKQQTEMQFRDDFQKKKEKSEKEFQKWLTRKTSKRKGPEGNLLEKQPKPLDGPTQAKEKSEKAFLNWKKRKEKEIKRQKKEKIKEEEEKIESEKQKAERKIIAEKAFQQWKMKLEEEEKRKNAKERLKERRREMEERRRRAEGSQISFEMWKEGKDNQRKEETKKWREADKAAREERFAQMEERMYIAEQAFEEWLQRVDLRKQTQFYTDHTYQKPIPWIPA